MGPSAKFFRHQLRRSSRTLLPPPSSTPLQNPNPIPNFLSSSSASSFLFNHHHGRHNRNPSFHPPFSSRSFSWAPWSRSSDPPSSSSANGPGFSPATGSEPETGGDDGEISGATAAEASSGFGSDLGALDGSELVPELSSPGLDVPAEEAWYSPAVHAVVSGLDGFHDLTGLPWWVVISASTLVLRATLFPVLILQLKKGDEIAKFLPKLPPPFPPPLSGRSFVEQYLLFQNKRRELGCPSYMWSFAYFIVQFPCFLLWMTSIRRMCLGHHHGFDNGGTLWFSDLTGFPTGILGSAFPILIASLHYTNVQKGRLWRRCWSFIRVVSGSVWVLVVLCLDPIYIRFGRVQISFRTFKLQTLPGIFGLLAKYYKLYLDILAIPLLLIGFHVPQGSLVYWATNSSLTLIQSLSLRNPYIRNKLGLSVEKISEKKVLQINVMHEGNSSLQHEMSAEALPSHVLFDFALEALAAGDHEKAHPLLRLAIDKDPESVRALIAMGQILFSKMSFEEAAEYFEKAISKVNQIQQEDDEDGFLVLALFGAGLSRAQQGRKSEGIEHWKRIVELKVPDRPMPKACYYNGLVMLGSTLFNDGEKSEAVKYLKIAAEYNPDFNAYVKECEDG